MFSLLAGCSQVEQAPRSVQKGILEIKENRLDTDVLDLNGEWHFQSEFLAPEKWKERLPTIGVSESEGRNLRSIEGSWTMATELDPALPSDGRASYALKWLLSDPESYNDLALKIPTINTSYQLFLNGQLLLEMGDIQSRSRTLTDAMRPRIVRIPGEILEKENEILINVANYGHRQAGLWSAPRLGNESYLRNQDERSVAMGLFLAGGLVLIGLYHLGLFLTRRSESAPLYFALYCILVALWAAQSGEKLLARLISGLDGETALRLEYICLYLSVASFLMFARRLYREDMPRWPARFVGAFALLSSVSGLVLPLRQFVWTLPPMQIAALAAVAICTFWTVQILRRKRLGARPVAFSLAILALTVTNDVLVAMSILPGIYLAQYGLMIFIVGQSFALSTRLSNAFNELEDLSRDLETRVDQRTGELDALNELTRSVNESQDLGFIVSRTSDFMVKRLGMRRMFLFMIHTQDNTLRGNGGQIGDLPEEDRQFFEDLRTPIEPDLGTLYRTIQRKKTLYLDFSRVRPPESMIDRRVVERLKMTSVVQIPAMVDGKVLGVATIDPGSKKLNRHDLSRLEAVVAQISGAVQKQFLLQAVEEENQEVKESKALADKEQKNSEILAELSRVAIESKDIDSILIAMQKPVTELVGPHGITIYLPDPEATLLSARSVIHTGTLVSPEDLPNSIRYVALKPESGTLHRCFSRAKTMYLPRISKAFLETSPVDLAIQSHYQLTWCYHIPLVVNDRVIGIASLAGQQPSSLGFQDKLYLERMIAQVAGAIQMQELLHTIELEKETAHLLQRESTALADFTRLLNQRADLNSIVEEVCRYAVQSLGLRGAFIAIVDDVEHEFQSIGGSGIDYTYQQEIFVRGSRVSINADAGLYFSVYQRKKSLYLPRIPSGQGPFNAMLADLFELQSFALIPLLLEDRVIGLMAVDPGKRKLSRQDLKRLETYADHVAGAINNASLFQRVEEQRSSIEGLARITRIAASTDNLDEILDQIFAYVHRRYGIASGVVMLPNPDGTELVSYRVFSYEDRDALVLHDAFAYAQNLRLPIAESGGILARTFLRGKPFYVADARRLGVSDREYPGAEMDREIANNLKYRGYFSLPMHVKEEPVALLNFTAYKESFKLNRSVREELKTLADQLAGIIRTNSLVRAVREESRRAAQAKKETDILARLSRKANETTNLQMLSQGVFDVLRETLNLQNQGLFLVNDTDTELVPVHFDTHENIQNWDTEFRVPLKPEGGTLFKTWTRRKSTYLPRLPLQGAAWPDLEIVRRLKITSVLQIPLIVTDRVVAIFACGPTRSLSREEIRSAERYCEQIAGAVRVIALLQATQEAREEAVVAKEEAEVARAESDALLENVLPSAAARELKERGHVEPIYYDSVSVLFTDFVGFTKAAANLSPAELIQELDGCFSQFDEVSWRNSMEKLKTIGDAYMCAGGLPVPNEGHAIDACLTALEFRSFMKQMAEVKQQLGFQFWQIRIGIHSGPVTAGVIGQNKFAYDIWGDTVNVASRMESSGSPGMVNISGATYDLVKDLFECEHRGKVQAKGKGEMDMYFLHRIKPELSADEDGLLPNAMFELARTDMDMEELDELRRDVAVLKGEVSTEAAGNSNKNGSNSGPDSPGRKKKKLAGARPLSDIDDSRQGW
ncbi:MAG: adenylate/guanylate cyclase domain-containing protein [Leptospiraceae bacterium]